MAQEPVVIPDKIYFKIGEVCDLVGVQAHVLRYWETEFNVLSPQKNKSGQRSYRRRDVEIAIRIKQLLYNEMFTIAGAKKKIQSEQRDGSKTKTATVAAPRIAELPSRYNVEAPMLFDTGFDGNEDILEISAVSTPNATFIYSGEQKDVLRTVRAQLLELREMLRTS